MPPYAGNIVLIAASCWHRKYDYPKAKGISRQYQLHRAKATAWSWKKIGLIKTVCGGLALTVGAVSYVASSSSASSKMTNIRSNQAQKAIKAGSSSKLKFAFVGNGDCADGNKPAQLSLSL